MAVSCDDRAVPCGVVRSCFRTSRASCLGAPLTPSRLSVVLLPWSRLAILRGQVRQHNKAYSSSVLASGSPDLRKLQRLQKLEKLRRGGLSR